MDVRPDQLPDDAALLKQIIVELQEALRSSRRQISQMEHRLQQLLLARYGQKAEKVNSAQLLLFAQEILARSQQPGPVQEEPATECPRRGHGRGRLPRNLPRKRIVVDVPADERRCNCCGAEMTKIGEEVSEQLEYVPASAYIIETVRPKYACKNCPDGTVATADKPRQPIEKGLPGPGMLAHVITSKYCDHLPLNRLEHIFGRHGLHIRRSTMCGWMAASAKLLAPLYDLMVEGVLDSESIHTDDTPVAVLDRDRDKTRTGRLWTYRGDDLHPYTVYDYTPSRKRDGPAEFLGSYNGYLQADAYGGYDGIYANGQITEVLCWAHARRKFFAASDSDAGRAHVAMAHIRMLYGVERRARQLFDGQDDGDGKRSLAEIRLELRRAESLEVLEELHSWMLRQADGVDVDGQPLPQGPALPKSPLAIAINYCLGNWPALTRYAANGELDIDNNASERDLRPIAVGRNNWTFFGSDNGGHTAAVLYSLIATAKRHGLDPFAYLRNVIGRISDHPSNRLQELLPDHWKLAQQAAVSQQAQSA